MSEAVRILDRYELVKRIGRGAMGEVFQGRDLQTDDPVAVKVLRSELIADHPELVERFRREGEALRRLNHPNIVKVLATTEADNRYYLVMEYVGGGTLADLLKRQPQLPLDRALAIALELADALTRTHHLNIVHRDIKPANILLAEDGTPRLTDFGLAYEADARRLTRTGITVGTWLYLSPEVCTGSRPDIRSDIWSFGIVLYEMLAGHTPFSGDSLPSIVREITEAPLVSVTEFRDDMPAALDSLVHHLLMKDAVARIGSFRQIGAELEAIAEHRRIPEWNTSPANSSAASAPDSVTIEVQWTDEMLPAASAARPRLLTRLTVPPLRPKRVDRKRLVQALDEGLQRGHWLTLVSAPPGFGKTTLVSAWLSNHPDRSAAWLSLDVSDNDPVQFFEYLVAAFQQVEPGIGRITEQLLQSPQFPGVANLVTPLINDVTRGGPLILVIDDYHVITSVQVHEAVRFLLEHLPHLLHLVIISREDPPLPLARLRVRDQLSEIRERDLSFTADETALFLTETLHLPLSPEAITQLGARTEGWPAGLQLAGLALQENQGGVDSFIAGFTGDHRYVMDYVLNEVLERQPPDVRDFLFKTSILDRLTAPLCDAVTGRTDCQAILDQLDHANLFVIPLDAKRAWYRYHQLFADVLRLMLRSEEQVELHGRAAAWFEAQADRADSADVLRHALAAARISGDYREVVRLIGVYIEASISDGRLVTVLGWLDALPDPVIRHDPDLATYRAWLLALTGDAAHAAEYADAGDRLVSPSADERNRGRLRLVHSLLALSRGDLEQAIQDARAALALLPAEHPHWRLMSVWVLSEAQERGAPISEAIASLHEACGVARLAGNLIMAAMLDASLVWCLSVSGQRREALAVCQQALARYTDAHGHLIPIATLLLGRLAHLHYEANELVHADAYQRQAQALSEQLGLDSVIAASDGIAAMLRLAEGDMDGALSLARQAIRQAAQQGLADVTWMAAIEGDVYLHRGDLNAAQRWAEDAGLTLSAEPHYLHVELHLTYARLLLAQGRFPELQDWLMQLEKFVTARGYRRWLVSVRILQALAAEFGRDGSAVGRTRDYLAEAVDLAAPEDYIRLFLNEDARIIALLPRVRSSAPAFVDTLLDAEDDGLSLKTDILPDALSARETEVLGLIARGLSNADIAERLVLSVGTVKQHINHIYGKLDVHSRMQAVVQARTLGLLSEK